ncbi:MAG: hypothetical protein KatS3mg025_0093 [Bacteroidia bacterium]|nr:MAG: hypothetical protein KatS3mg025_0093 [Bacteroidia bacterium]
MPGEGGVIVLHLRRHRSPMALLARPWRTTPFLHPWSPLVQMVQLHV